MKSFRRTLSPITKPFSFVHKTFVGLGFIRTMDKQKPLYRLTFRSSETNQEYSLYVTTQTLANGQAEVLLPQARFEHEELVPDSVLEAAQSKLYDLVDYLEQHSRTLKSVEDVPAGMAPDEDEMVKLGKQMKHLKTNSQLIEEGFIPDPIQ
jgi:hypothetical protein